jgi:uncharacterized protein (TIGR02284 family)
MDNHKEIAKAVNGLIEKNEDAHKGFLQAKDKAESSGLKTYLAEQAGKREKYADELRTEVGKLETSKDAETSGSASGSLHRGWMSIKNALSSGDEAILEECINGDKAMIEEYKKTWEDHRNLPSQLMDMMSKQVTDIQSTQSKVKTLEDLK